MRPPTILLLALSFGFALAGCTTTAAPAKQQAQAREAYLFTSVLTENMTTLGVAPDAFYPPNIIINKGDTLTIHFYNTEETTEQHSFTMQAPYAMDHVLDAGKSTNITLTANDAGVYTYACKFHAPSMIGTLVVLG